MDSQDSGHMYFTNLLSQNPQLDPTYGGQSGNSPMTIDASPPLPPNEPNGVRKSVRSANFTPEEDKLLVSKHSQLWQKIFEYFQQYKETTNEPTIKSLIHRWSVIQKATNKFCAKLAPVEGLNQSGMTEQDKNQPKWIWRATKDVPMQRKTMSPSLTLTSTRCSAPTEDSESRAQEKEFYRLKAEKIEYDKEKEEKKLCLEDERLRMEAEKMRIEEEKMRIEAEKEQSKIRQEDERLRLEAEKVELAKKESDRRIMMMDVSVMPEMQQLYFQQLQREIMMRRSNARDLD
ncbi:hypothetical protein CIPAW_12G038500 [Carya illinoinensis]|uniref:No apical meristem-associated C-terminal domain-containing protein n=1 Tax=Carya illinoinensis TaxID=32201 RepID=A0A8T1NVU9_CARIL|nr:hypothetical protein CIPAW_12G038500 [Carya illinoinensis]